jgi:hypothetical protein
MSKGHITACGGGMLSVRSEKVQQYLDKAEKCESRADKATNPDLKEIFLECAKQWRRLAREVQALERG